MLFIGHATESEGCLRVVSRLSLRAALLLGLVFLPLNLCGQVNGVGQRPALGWGSWTLQLLNGQSWANEANIKAQSDAMKISGLQDHGYVFINIDSGWQSGFDQYGRPMVSTSLFPNGLEALVQHIHSNGQKAGIYWIPGIQYPVYTGGGTIYGTSDPIESIVTPGVPGNAFSYIEPCCNYWHMKIDFTKPGAQEYVNSVVNLFASWGFDAIKLDGVTPGSDYNNLVVDNRAEVQAWSTAIAQSGRPMELTVSWNLDHNYLSTWQAYANARRIDDDVNCYCSTATQWFAIARLFTALEKWQHDAGPTLGWNDLDSLLVGNGVVDGLSQDERQTTMTLWAIANSPMIIGDDLNQLDAFGMQLLTNDDVIAVNQSGASAREVTNGDNPVWASPALSDGSYNAALFNLTYNNSTTTISLSSLGIAGPANVFDLWAGKDMGTFTESYSATLNLHGSALIRITPSTPVQVPEAPNLVTAEAGNGQIRVSWSASSGATSYNIYRGTSSGDKTKVAGGITGIAYTDTAVTNGSTYYYEVTAVNSSGESAQSNEVSATPTAGFSVSRSSTSLSLSSGSGQASSTITITPNGDTRTLTFSCSNLPAGYNCAFSPSSLALSDMTAPQTVTLTVSRRMTSRLKTRGVLIATLLPLGVCLVVFAPGRGEGKRRRNALIAVAVLAVGLGLTACGSSSNPAPPTPPPPPSPSSYTFQVTLQTDGSTVETLNYTLTVQ